MGEWIYRAALVGILASAALTFAILLFFSAPYGRHSRKGWGVTLDPRWAWIIMEAPAFLVMVAMALFGHSLDGATVSEGSALSLLFFCLWELHYAYRSFIYPFRIRNTNKHPFPLVLITMAILFNSANAYVNGWWLFASGFSYGSSWLTNPRCIVGIALFFLGAWAHLDSDNILRGLRGPGESGYKIPSGGLFRYISSPNYLGEIVEWSGFALATWSVAGLAFTLFTIANLLPRALSNHSWYLVTFPDYPKERKALIPFIL